MNDNRPRYVLRQLNANTSRHDWLEQIQAVRSIGIRAIAKPESLTMGEIQDIAWGFLMAAKTLEKMAATPD